MHIISLLGTFRSVANIEMASFARRGIAVMLAALACVWAQADDFIVNVGETGRIEGTKTYGRILCNGELEIADDAVVTCTSFVMASGIVQNVKVEIGNNATVTVNGATGSTTSYECAIGMDGGSGTLTLGTNATLHCTQGASMQTISSYAAAAFTAEDPFPSTAKMMLHIKKGAAFTGEKADSQFIFDGGSRLNYSRCARFLGNTIRLDEDAYMDFCSYMQYGRPDSRILFNGGRLKQSIWNNTKTSTILHNTPNWLKVESASLYLTSTNGNDIVVERGSWASAVFGVGAGSSGTIATEGDGDFVLCSKGTSPNAWVNGSYWTMFIGSNDMPAGMMSFKHRGAIRFEGTAWIWLIGGKVSSVMAPMTRNNFIADRLFNGSHDLKVGPNVRLDLFGNTVKAKKLEASSANVMSTCTTNNATLIFGLGNADCRLEAVGTNVVCVKCGTGGLVMSNATDLAELNVTTGGVSFASLPGGPAVGIDMLALGKNTSFTLSDGRTLAVSNLVMDSSASASVASFAPAAAGSLNLTSFTRTPGLQLLPFAVQEMMVDAANLSTWSLYFDGAIQGTVGVADPKIRRYKGCLALGTPGMIISFQ